MSVSGTGRRSIDGDASPAVIGELPESDGGDDQRRASHHSTNSGPNTLAISSIAVTGTNPGDFAQTNNCPVSPATLAVSGFCTINVTFTPMAASLRSAAITIADNGAGSRSW